MQFTPPPHKNAKIQLFGGNTELTACFAVLYVALRAIYYVFHPHFSWADILYHNYFTVPCTFAHDFIRFCVRLFDSHLVFRTVIAP